MVCEERDASPVVTAVVLPEAFEAERFRHLMHNELAVTLAIGFGNQKQRVFRLGHLGHVNEPTVLGTLGAIELDLTRMRIPHGTGAIDAAVRALETALRAAS